MDETLSYQGAAAQTELPVFALGVDAAGRPIFGDFSPACELATGLRAEDLVNLRPEDVSVLATSTAATLSMNCRRCLDTGAPVGYDEEFEWPVGIRCFHVLLVPMPDDAGRDRRIMGVLQDITERKKNEDALRCLNRKLQALSSCNQTLLRAEDERALLSDVCRIVCDEAGYCLAWVGYAEDDKAKTVRPVAWAGVDSNYIAHAKLSWSAETECGQGPAGIAIRSGMPVYVQDFETDSRMAPWRDFALQCGYRSGVALPLKNEHAHVFGVLLLYHEEANAMTPDEVRFMGELADDLAFGVNVLRTRTERKRSAEALLRKEEEHRALLETIPDFVVRYNTDLRRTYVNPAWEKASGLSCEEVLNVPAADIPKVPQPAAHEYVEKLRQVLKTGTPQAVEFSWVNAYGKTLFLEYAIVPEYDRDGEIVGVLSVGRDFTRRKRAEEKMLRSDQRLRLHSEQSPLGFLEWDDNFRAVEWNAACERIFGYTREEAVGRHAKELILPIEVQDLVDGIYQSLMSQTGGQHSINENITKDGRIIICEWFNTTLIDQDGKAIGVASVCRDITESRRAEQIMQARLRLMQFSDTHSLNELFQATLDEAEALTGSSIGFYHFVSADQRKLTLQTWSTNTLSKMCATEGTEHNHPIDEAGVWVDCIRERRPVIHNDYAALPHCKGTPPVQRELVVPVFRGDRVVAVLGVGNKSSEYDQNDVTATEMLADFAWDIVEHKRAEEELRRSERIKTILNEIAGTFLTVPDDEVYGEVVTLVCQVLKSRFGVFGYIGENGDLVMPSLTRDVWTECQVPDKAVVFPSTAWGKSLWERAIRERKTFCSDGPFHMPEGHVRIERFLTVPIVFGDETIGLICVANGPHSYTEEDRGILESIAAYIAPILNARLQRDRQEEKRERAEEMLRRLSHAVEQSPASIVITDAEGSIEYVNPKFEQLTGYTSAEAIGQNPRILKSGETSDEEYRQLWETITHGDEWRGEFHNRKKNGDMYWESASISPVLGAHGEIEHFVAVKEDITARKQSEQALAASEFQLRQSQKMDAIGRLAGGVAHDFNNLLAGVMNYVELCRDELSEEHPIQEYLKEITRDAARSARMARQLLAFAREQETAPVVLDLNGIIAEMIKLLRHLIGEAIDLEWGPGMELWPVEIDPSQIDQILVNLCVNARDAIDGVGKVIIETQNIVLDGAFCLVHTEAVPGEYVLLTVSDTGCGMNEETVARIFEPFFTTKGPGEGTGLGLATLYGIVKQNRGFVDVRSEVGEGTTFFIYLPRSPKAVETKSVEERRGAAPSGSETILLVDDERSLRVTCGRFLEKLDYTVLSAESPEKAMEIARQHTGMIDLLITDVVMPGMNGIELAEALKTSFPGLRVLFMSGYSNELLVRCSPSSRNVDFLQKPFMRNQLIQAVRQVLDSEQSSTSA